MRNARAIERLDRQSLEPCEPKNTGVPEIRLWTPQEGEDSARVSIETEALPDQFPSKPLCLLSLPATPAIG